MTIVQVPPRILLVLLVAHAISACSNKVDVEIDDRVRFGDLQTSIPYSADGRKRIRIRTMRTSGELRQSLEPLERIKLDDVEIIGPTEVTGDIDITQISIAAGSDDYVFSASSPDARTSFYWGLSYTEFDLSLDNVGRRFSKSDNSVALYLQLGSVHPIGDSWRFGVAGALNIEDLFFSVSPELEFRVEYLLYRHAVINGGLRLFFYEYDNDDGDSDIGVDFSGPFIGLNVPF